MYVGLGSTVDMDGAATRIYNNTATFGGGAVVSGTSSNLYIFGGAQIVDNYAAGSVASGGGIYAANGALITGEGARIAGNRADLLGGGVHLIQGGASLPTQLLLDDGAELRDNRAAYGGAINLSTGDDESVDLELRDR